MEEDGQLVAEFDKNNREKVRVRLTEYGKHKLIDIRAFYPDPVTGEMKPGKGIALQRDRIPELKKAIAAAERASKEG